MYVAFISLACDLFNDLLIDNGCQRANGRQREASHQHHLQALTYQRVNGTTMMKKQVRRSVLAMLVGRLAEIENEENRKFETSRS